MFYTYSQNNSGGRFRFDEASGITQYVIVEADNPVAANERAVQIGLYFDGVEDGFDCECCGDRWSEKWQHDSGDAEPMIYDTPVKQYTPITKWREFPDGKDVCIHYADGRKEWS